MNGINRAWVQETHWVDEIIQAIKIALNKHSFITRVYPFRARHLKETTEHERAMNALLLRVKHAEIGAQIVFILISQRHMNIVTLFILNRSLLARLQGNLRIMHNALAKIKWVGTQFGSWTHFLSSSHTRVIKKENKHSDHEHF